MRAGVTIVDPATTWIDVDVSIGRDTTVLPGTRLLGATSIGVALTDLMTGMYATVAVLAALMHRLQTEPELRDRIIAATPMGRIAPADELADTVLYLASNASRFVTGQIVTVDGGRSLADRVAVQTA